MIYDFSHIIICLLWFFHGLPKGEMRSEERRVGKECGDECRSRCQQQKQNTVALTRTPEPNEILSPWLTKILYFVFAQRFVLGHMSMLLETCYVNG